ncbi:MAG: hypothetical protein DUD32_06050 [Lactobacillus sp.]|nr:MAG: hypothetical protein DUD32_06050 [Lactobacillus sp.]
MDISKLFATFLAAGGLGFINYSIADRLDLVEFNNEKSNMRLPFMLAWTIPDFAIYLLVSYFVSRLNGLKIHHLKIYLNNNVELAIALLITLILVYFLSLWLLPIVFKHDKALINFRRKKYGHAELFVGSAWNKAFDNDRITRCYVYGFDKTFLVSGEIKHASSDAQSTQMTITPFINDINECPFNELIEQFTKESFQKTHDVRQLLDYDKKVIIVTVEDTDDDGK